MIKTSIQSFLKNSSGNLTLSLALSCAVLMAAAGAAIDYNRISRLKNQLDAFADASALAAISSTFESSDKSDAAIISAAQKVALDLWNSNMRGANEAKTTQPKIEVYKKNDTWMSKVTYKAKLQNSLMAGVGLSNSNVAGMAVASGGAGLNSHWQFYFAVDTSASMGIGATQNDMQRMQADPRVGCMFACHGNDTVNGAKQAGYRLRLDVVSDALDGALNQLKAARGFTPEATVLGFTTSVKELVPMTKDMSKIQAKQLDIDDTPQSVGNTDYKAVLADLTGKVGKSGNGTSASSPKKMMIMITDGIHDTTYNVSNVFHQTGPAHYLGPIDAEFCKKIKSDGTLLGVLYIDYIIPPDYADWINPFAGSVLPQLQACASPNMFINATEGAKIEEGLKKLIGTAIKSDVRITQ